MAKAKKPKRSLLLHVAMVTDAERKALEGKLSGAAHVALARAESYLRWMSRSDMMPEEKAKFPSLARANLVRARASYVVACQVRGMHWPEFESRYNTTADAVVELEARQERDGAGGAG